MFEPAAARTPRASSMPVAVFGTLLTAVFVLSILRVFDWNPASFLHVGEDAPAILGYVEDRLGEVPTFGGLGHDGKYFFIQAHDPLLLDPESHAAFIDRSAYRYQRILYPVIAAPGLVAGESGLVWWLLLINVLAVGFGTWITSQVAVALGASPWWGLAFGLNPGVIFEVVVDGAGVVALALGMAGLLMIVRARLWLAVVVFAMAGLTREVMLLMVFGCALSLWKKERMPAILVAAVPTAAVAAWGVYVRIRLGVDVTEAQSFEIGPPFAGFASAVRQWVQEPGFDLVFGIALVAVCLMVIRRFVIERTLVTLAITGFVALAVFLTDRVWLHYFDITRALAPIVTGFALIVASDRRKPEPS